MATGLEYFERDLRLATAGLEPDQINKALAAFAKQELRRVISSGQASPNYERYVNETKGLPEEAVRVPGAILYQFINWSALIRTALEELRKRVPVKSGRYASGFIVLANQRPVQNYRDIKSDDEVVILNVRPYTRRLETSKTGRRTARYMNPVKTLINTRYEGVFLAEMKFLTVSPGIHPDVPYILKRGGSRRKDRQPGMPISYPAIVINAA